VKTTSTQAPTLNHWIAGPRDGLADRKQPITNSATGEICAFVPMSVDAVDAAVRAAADAYPAWADATLGARAEVMFRFRQLMKESKTDLASVVTREHGKVLADAEAEVQRGLEVVDYACGLAELLKGEISTQVSRGVDSYSMRRPLGVVAGITPFNFPVMVPMWMVPVALAAGNAFVLKPSEQDPSASVMIAELFDQAGLPPGVLSVVHGGRESVDALLEHPEVEAVSFVGSTSVARHVYELGTRHGKRVQALGGAKNHAVILPDADLDLTADGLVSAGFGSAGQRCMAVSVAVLVGDVGKELIPRLRERMAALAVNDGMEPGADMGPLVSDSHLDRVRAYVEAGLEEGADLLVDGRGISVPGRPKGHFIGPSLFGGVEPGMSIYDEEIFGPVLVLVERDSYPDALELLRSNPYGNGAAVFTRDGGAARRFEYEAPAGMVGINVPIPVPMAYHSFGGWKDSLIGDLHVHGSEGFRFYTRGKVVTRRWPDPSQRGVNLGFPTA
jgi:malonate-semialdehyde dehydrogenase (acetylating)/methylmalonate-semialdehyde dehydrogenase